MKVTEKNIKQLCEILNETFGHTNVVEYDGWTDQVNPFDIVRGTKIEEDFLKKYRGNVRQNSFLYAEMGHCLDEKFVRLVSDEYDMYNEEKQNFVIRQGMDISVDVIDKQVVIIDNKNSLKELLKKDDDVFTVFLFDSQYRLNELNEFCI